MPHPGRAFCAISTAFCIGSCATNRLDGERAGDGACIDHEVAAVRANGAGASITALDPRIETVRRFGIRGWRCTPGKIDLRAARADNLARKQCQIEAGARKSPLMVMRSARIVVVRLPGTSPPVRSISVKQINSDFWSALTCR